MRCFFSLTIVVLVRLKLLHAGLSRELEGHLGAPGVGQASVALFNGLGRLLQGHQVEAPLLLLLFTTDVGDVDPLGLALLDWLGDGDCDSLVLGLGLIKGEAIMRLKVLSSVGIIYLRLVEANLLGHFFADLLSLAVAVQGLLLLADADVVGVAPLGVLDLGHLGLGLDLLLFVFVNAELHFLGFDLGCAVRGGDDQALLSHDGGLDSDLLSLAGGLQSGHANLSVLLLKVDRAVAI